MTAAFFLLSLVTLQRLAELAHARHNTRRLRAEGAIEIGARHYPLLVILHAAWLAALWLWLLDGRAVFWWPAGIAYLIVECGRAWVMISLGRFWTTRILVPRDASLVRRGPYRHIRHPNYWVVAGEVALLPLALGAWPLALIFSLTNAVVLAWRIRIENTTLGPRRGTA